MRLLTIPCLNELIALRRDIHAHPEVAFQERRTADIVATELERAGLDVYRGVGQTGVVGVLKAGTSRRCIGLRADMDALPITEQNDFAHRSVVPGVCHACGHDGHTVMLLGAARYLAGQFASTTDCADFDGSVVFIFQPAEEAEGGATGMIADGLLRRFPLDSIYGLHNWPDIEAGKLAIFTGPVMAGVNRFQISLHGRGGHAAMPHLASDVIVAASQLTLSLQTVVARSLNPLEAAVLSVTRLESGNTWNVLPEDAVLRGSIRILDSATQPRIENAITRLAEGTAAAYGVSAHIEFMYIDPPTINAPQPVFMAQEAARNVVGAVNVIDKAQPSMAAEDFSCLARECPGCYVWLGSGATDRKYGLHNPRYDFNDAIIPVGISWWVELTRQLLSR